MEDMNQIMLARKEKFNEIKAMGKNMYPNDFKPKHKIADIVKKYKKFETREEIIEAAGEEVFSIAGRIMFMRKMGKLAFVRVQDGSDDIQIAISVDGVGEDEFKFFKNYSDLGDLIGATGTMGMTNTGEMTLQVTEWRLLNKTLRPLPDKFHGLTDTEVRYRQRYVDLIMNKDVRETFRKRSQIISEVRNYFAGRDYMEVETPAMQVLQGGASASPFVTHHNALDMPMYMRVAPELYLKRLVVGGFDRVFEIGKNFRNEGVSTRHNPEFTMLEWYGTHMNYHDQMDFVQDLMTTVCEKVTGGLELTYGDVEISFKPEDWARVSMKDAVKKWGGATDADLADEASIRAFAKAKGVHAKDGWSFGFILNECFEELCEHHIVNPTFIMDHPIEVSPLAKLHEGSTTETERAELFIAGREYSNLFSELNDPIDQAERFAGQMEQAKEGDEEAMPYDKDFVRALEYGLMPTGGAGLGIDRFVMLLTNAPSIRDVIFFPHMKAEAE
ncbi:MAG: Lysine--tRNA ligase [Proteobacteria bacterium]|nr:MAG: Lysine--tRNA ligase [Pseudomonadota bacterium]